MPAGRIILKSISDSKKISDLKTDGARLLYTWLLTHLDINGCYSGDAQVLNGKIFTRLKKSNKTIESYLKDLEENKLIIRYKDNGDIFLNVPDFVEKQPSLNPNKEAKPTIPPPTPELLQSYSRVTPPQVKESKVKESKVKESKVKDKKRHFAEFVTLTLKEYRKLKSKYGKDDTKKLIDKLDNTKGANLKLKYDSDYRAILKWVIDAVIKDKPKGDWRRT